jgi:hypothetical protein
VGALACPALQQDRAVPGHQTIAAVQWYETHASQASVTCPALQHHDDASRASMSKITSQWFGVTIAASVLPVAAVSLNAESAGAIPYVGARMDHERRGGKQVSVI